MKKLSLILLISFCVFGSCDQSEEEKEPTLRDKLLKTWTLTEEGYVKSSGVDITDTFSDLAFTFKADGTYNSIVNGNSVEGLWRATDSSASTLILDETVTVNVLELSDDRLLMSFTSEGMINARTKGVSMFEVLLSAP